MATIANMSIKILTKAGKVDGYESDNETVYSRTTER